MQKFFLGPQHYIWMQMVYDHGKNFKQWVFQWLITIENNIIKKKMFRILEGSICLSHEMGNIHVHLPKTMVGSVGKIQKALFKRSLSLIFYYATLFH